MGFEALELKEKTDYPKKVNSSLHHQGKIISEDGKEEVKAQETADVKRYSEQLDQVENKLALPTSSPLPSETNDETKQIVMETTSGELSEISSEPTTSA